MDKHVADGNGNTRHATQLLRSNCVRQNIRTKSCTHLSSSLCCTDASFIPQ